jgi:hypothetical protein
MCSTDLGIKLQDSEAELGSELSGCLLDAWAQNDVVADWVHCPKPVVALSVGNVAERKTIDDLTVCFDCQGGVDGFQDGMTEHVVVLGIEQFQRPGVNSKR